MTPPTNPKPTIGELFDLPDHVRSDDFVLRLTEAILRPELTVKDYVVTGQLRGCFDDALSLVRDSVTGRRSSGAYLHGSFGTGKSHFMAVLYLLLSNDARARSLPDLAEVVAKHDWTTGKKFLLVPYHMIGAETVEERVLGGYLDRIRELHPDVQPPGLYDADAMVSNARKLRQQFKDEDFFRALNQSVSNDGWGDAPRWDERSFEAAAVADARSRDRAELVGALAHTLMPGARHTVATVDLDTGLSLMSQHAKSLGYDAVILFLDEMILWLASRAADPAWITREGPKLAKLVESGNANRPAPIVSFVARQRAIRDLIGKAGLGANQALVEEALEWWEKRFTTITLEDKNLSAIARRRLLKPKSEAARQLIDAEFANIGRLGNSVIDTIVTSKSDRGQFRDLYPFTPALIEILVAVASALQRERTVLNIMAQVLVKSRNRMRLGELVSVGELFVELRDGYDPFGSSLKQQFDNARKLWERKLRPLIEADAGASYDDLDGMPPDDPKARQLRAHERIAGTLILTGLASDLEPLRGLTGPRLAALNYGSLRPFIPGTEGRDALALCRRWATGVGEIRISPGTESQASINVQLTSVDIESILDNAKHEDSHGNRLLKVTDLFFREMEMDSVRQYPLQAKVNWRGTPRSYEISILNVREAGDRELRPTGDDWHLVIDLPIDRENYSPSDDLAQLRKVRTGLREPLRTLVWLPTFLSDRTRTELGRYAILDYLLKPDKLREYTQHLTAIEREEARAVMDSMKRELEVRLRAAIRAAYGVGKPEAGALDESMPLDPSEQFQSLNADLQLQPPAGENLADSARRLVRQALTFEFPGHPEFNEDDVKLGRKYIELAYNEVLGALRDPEGRKATEKDVRKQIRPLLEPLRLAQVTEQNTVPLRDWHDHFDRKEAQYGGPVTVGKLRDWMNEPKRMGLPRDLQDLVILVYAAQSNCSFRDAFGPADPAIGRLRDEWKLEPQELPSQADWDVARERSSTLFGKPASALCNASNLDKFAADVVGVATAKRDAARKLLEALKRVAPAGADRVVTANACVRLLDKLDVKLKPIDVVKRLVSTEIATNLTAMDRSMVRAADVVTAIDHCNWTLLEGLKNIPAGAQILARLDAGLAENEYVTPLADRLRECSAAAARLVLERTPPPPPQPPVPSPPPTPVVPPPPTPTTEGRRTIAHESRQTTPARLRETLTELERAAEAHPESEIEITWEIRE
jgi:hypothetical protein